MKIVVSDFLKFTKQLVENLNFDEIDSFLDDKLGKLGELDDDVSKILGPVKTLITIKNIYSKNRIKRFCKSYAEKISEFGEVEMHDKGKMFLYLQKKKNLDYLSEIIEAGLHAKSENCSALLGYLAGKIMNDLVEYKYEDIVIIEALKIMNDFGLDNFMKLYKHIISSEKIKKESFQLEEIKNEVEFTSYHEARFTIEKLKSVQILMNGHVITYLGTSPITTSSNSATDALYNLINESKLHSGSS